MPVLDATTTGTVAFEDGQTWYRITGDIAESYRRGLPPLVVLHGGPGAGHNYTLRMAMLSTSGRAVVHYDQFGCGNSSHRPERGADYWTVDLFLRELDTVLNSLEITDSYHLIGQSWGGMLGAEHAIRKPSGMHSLTIADSPASMTLWLEAANALRAQLPEQVQAVLLEHEAAGTTDSAAYREATEVFNHRHVCRVVPNPDEVLASDTQMYADPTVYYTMNGPNEFHVVGSLKSWSVVGAVSAIEVPTLVINGAYDEATNAVIQPFLDEIPDVRWHQFPNSSHMPHVEEEEDFLSVVGDFLASTDPTIAT